MGAYGTTKVRLVDSLVDYRYIIEVNMVAFGQLFKLLIVVE